jgi:transposase InsO family protein
VITAWMTDHGPSFVSRRARQLCATWQHQHRRTRPYRPQTNGKAERVIQALLREWAYRRSYLTLGWRQRALLGYLQHYNHTRRHTALGYRPPVARLAELVNNVRINHS